jgi:exopolyphosphatase/guanosine-5'-triphosphate,3'-diphosphate pyrophosphatase
MTRRHLGRVRSGAQAEVIPGEREAELSFAGAVIDLPPQDGHTLVFDLGGGSTEFVVDAGRGGAYSTRMGCVRLTERFLHSDPPWRPKLRRRRSTSPGSSTRLPGTSISDR